MNQHRPPTRPLRKELEDEIKMKKNQLLKKLIVNKDV
jgi:hypothetical protein